jgi:hypothetical protein
MRAHFHRNLFTESLPSNERLLWLRYSGVRMNLSYITSTLRFSEQEWMFCRMLDRVQGILLTQKETRIEYGTEIEMTTAEQS